MKFLMLLFVIALAVPFVVAQQAASPGSQSSSNTTVDLAAVRKLIDRGQPKEALLQLDLAAAQRPPAAGIERLRGMALYAEGDFSEADQALAKALQENSKDIEAAELRGLTSFGWASRRMRFHCLRVFMSGHRVQSRSELCAGSLLPGHTPLR